LHPAHVPAIYLAERRVADTSGLFNPYDLIMAHRDKGEFDLDEPMTDEESAAEGDVQQDAAEAPAAPSPESTELTQARDKYLRLAAEFDNYRKRSMRERAEAEGKGQSSLIKQLLDPLDDLSRFAHVDAAMVDATTITQGVDLVERKIHKILASMGLEAIDPVGLPFDPSLHEAVTTEPAASKQEDHMVSKVFQVGYRHNGQLLRPARVVVKQWNG
jgi:molecular chaperone GrpE